ncbi:MAG: LacI family DNA-binding transcriptional regulator [Armatimonas sp.]
MSAAKPSKLEDVAQRAGVNKVTASIVLSGGRGNTRVSEATRQRIRKAAEELQYQPNALAQSLRRRRSHMLGLYLGNFLDTRNPFISEIISGLQLGCEENNRDFVMHGTFRGDSIDDIVAELLNGKVDGLVLHVGSDHPLQARLAASRLPVVVIANPAPGMASVTTDDVTGSWLQVKHLAERGHKRVLYAVSPFVHTSVIRRHEAFCVAAAAHGMTISSVVAEYGLAGLRTVEQAITQSNASERPTAIVCWNDEIAYPIVEHLRSQGLRVPDDLAVVGYDGWTSAIPTAYRLTTINAPWAQVARTAVGLLVSNSGKPEPIDTVLPVELIVGDTT